MARAMDTRLNMSPLDVTRQVEGFVTRYYGRQARKWTMDYDADLVRAITIKRNPHASGACNDTGECASSQYEVQAQCHIDCMHEWLVEAYYGKHAGTLVAVATCGAMSVWMD